MCLVVVHVVNFHGSVIPFWLDACSVSLGRILSAAFSLFCKFLLDNSICWMNMSVFCSCSITEFTGRMISVMYFCSNFISFYFFFLFILNWQICFQIIDTIVWLIQRTTAAVKCCRTSIHRVSLCWCLNGADETHTLNKIGRQIPPACLLYCKQVYQ